MLMAHNPLQRFSIEAVSVGQRCKKCTMLTLNEILFVPHLLPWWQTLVVNSGIAHFAMTMFSLAIHKSVASTVFLTDTHQRCVLKHFVEKDINSALDLCTWHVVLRRVHHSFCTSTKSLCCMGHRRWMSMFLIQDHAIVLLSSWGILGPSGPWGWGLGGCWDSFSRTRTEGSGSVKQW